MSRPIPEGVEPDPQYVCKCGWRGEFSQSVSWGHSKGYCPRCSENGYVIPLVLADDRDSEVARLNQTSTGIPADSDQEFADRILKTLTDKDALIREMVCALQGMLDEESPGDIWQCLTAWRLNGF